MSDDNYWTDQQKDLPPPVKKKGMSGCLLTSLIAGGIGFVCMFACCGLGIWLAIQIVPSRTKMQAEVVAIGRQVLNIEMLAGFSPDEAATAENLFYSLHVAQFKHQEGKGDIVLGTVKFKYGNQKSAKEQSRDFLKPFEEDVRGHFTAKTTETHDITILGQKASILVEAGTDPESGKAVHVAKAEFEQASGQTIVVFRMDDEIWDQDAVFKMLEEAKAP